MDPTNSDKVTFRIEAISFSPFQNACSRLTLVLWPSTIIERLTTSDFMAPSARSPYHDTEVVRHPNDSRGRQSRPPGRIVVCCAPKPASVANMLETWRTGYDGCKDRCGTEPQFFWRNSGALNSSAA